MCSPRGVTKELEELKIAVERLAGSAGAAEYARILRDHGVESPKEFRTTQTARLCAKDVFALLEELRENVRENEDPPELGPENLPIAPAQPVAALEAR